uniref:TonB-dependent receptor plug domain-containing protein n=1 Tax=Flavobacterium sp. TaxID=239 RepID=UPI00404AB562
MTKLLGIVFVLLFCQNSWSQKDSKSYFYQQNDSLEKVILDMEVKFNIKFSFVANTLKDYQISIPKKNYNLVALIQIIESQTNLKIFKINERFYSIQVNQPQNSEKITYLDEIIVEGFVANGINKTSEKVTIYPQKVATVPGVTDADVLRSLQHLPGVKSPNETASGLHVRGGTADQNLILWDGIRLYHPGHLFGMISGINSSIADCVQFYNKAVNPKHGERVSSIIDIKSSEEITESMKVNAGVNALNVDANVQLPLIQNKLGMQVAARKSLTEWFQSTTFRQMEDKVFQNTVFNNFDNKNQFDFQDFATKINFKPNDGTFLSLSGIHIVNQLNYRNIQMDNTSENQEMSIANSGISFQWNQKYSARFKQELLLFYSAYDFDYLKKQTFSNDDFEAYKKLNRVVDSGLEANFKFDLSENVALDFGYQLLGNDVSHLFNTFNQDLGLVLSFKEAFNISHVGYASFKYKTKSWQLNSGIRYTNFKNLGNVAEPRFLVQRNLSDHLILQLSFEERSQILSQVRENTVNDLSLENYVWAIADRGDYPLQKSNQTALGFIYKKNRWLFDVDFYHKNTSGVTLSIFEFNNQNVSTIYPGRAFTNGLDVLIQKKQKNWSAWMTYTYQDSKNKFLGLNNNQFFPINSNIRHAVSLSGNKTWNRFSMTAGWFIHSGKPFSVIDEQTQDIFFNSETLSAYHRMDVSGSYEFNQLKHGIFKIGFSVYNLYNNKTIINKEFERRFTDFSDITSSRYTILNYNSLGLTPNLFFRYLF